MKLFIIARDNIKKKKGNTFILFLLVALAVMFLYVSISVLLNIDHLIDRRNASINGADYVLVTTSRYPDMIEDFFHKQDKVNNLEREKGIDGINLKYYSEDQTEEDAEQLEMLFFLKDTERSITINNVVDEGKEWKDNSIILPYYMKAGMGYKTGDMIHMLYNNTTFDFEIYGFTEDVMFASPSNVAMEKCYVGENRMKDLEREWKTETTMFRVDLQDNLSSEEFEKDTTNIITKDIPDFTYSNNMILNFESMKMGASITAKIFVGILTVFSLLLILIAMVIIHFNINNTIEMSIKNIGILEAIGYRTVELRLASYLEFLSVSILGAVFGLISAVGAGEFIGNILSGSIGLQWNLGFDFKSAILSVIITLLLVSITIGISSVKYNRITPLDALRNGIHVHNFRRNHIPLDRSKLPLNFALGVKNILFNKKKNVVLCLIVILFSFCMNLSFGLYQSFARDETNILKLTGIEATDILFSLQENDMQNLKSDVNQIKTKLLENKNIKNVISVTEKELKIYHGEKTESVSTDIYENTDVIKVDNVMRGRRPQYNNEIMITKPIADSLGVSIGDTVYLNGDKGKEDFVVVGYSQGTNHFGKKAMLTGSGLERLYSEVSYSQIYVYINDNLNLKDVYNSLKDEFSSEIVTVTNYQEYVTTVLKSINSIMIALCFIMMIVVVIVIALVLVLLIKTQVIRDQKQLGVSKAVGYTTAQLMIQIMFSYIPIVFVGTIIGCILSHFNMNNVFILCLSMFGIQKFGISMPIAYYMITVFGITVWSAIMAIVCSLRIRNISPGKIVREL